MGSISEYFNKQYLVLDPQVADFVEKHEHSRNSIDKDGLFNLIFNEFITTKKEFLPRSVEHRRHGKGKYIMEIKWFYTVSFIEMLTKDVQ